MIMLHAPLIIVLVCTELLHVQVVLKRDKVQRGKRKSKVQEIPRRSRSKKAESNIKEGRSRIGCNSSL